MGESIAHSPAPESGQKPLGSPVHGCPYEGSDANLVVLVSYPGGLLDGAKVTIIDSQGKAQTPGKSLATFKLTNGDYSVATELDQNQLKTYAQPPPTKVKISGDKPVSVLFHLKPLAPGTLRGLTSRFLRLVDGFTSVDEIIKPQNLPRLRSIAALADMSAEDFANFAIKRLVIRKGVLEQQVVIDFVNGNDKKKVKLGHPLAPDFALRYSDFLVDRSGPKFLGALDAEVAVDTLMYKDAMISTLLAAQREAAAKAKHDPTFDSDLVDMVRSMSERRLAELQGKAPAKYAKLTEAEVEQATSVFTLKHMAQRKLSDFDLTARDSEVLARSIGLALQKELADPSKLSEELILEIGRIAWSRGGPVDAALIAKVIGDDGKGGKSATQQYREATDADERFRADDKNKQFYHILIHEVGPEVTKILSNAIPVIDAYYGLGVPYYGFEVHEKSDALVFHHADAEKKHEGREEIGDVITDETSHYGRTFSHVRNMQATLNKLVKAGEAWSANNFEQTKNFRDNFHDLIAKSKQAAIVAEYQEREAFIDTMLMFEQVAKKEAQAQFFKVKKDAGKLIGNISDVSQFLFGVDIAQRVAQGQNKFKDVARCEALKEVVKLSCLVNFPRWDINAKNLAQVGDTAVDIKVEQFRRSINARSYGHLAPKLSDQPPPNDAFGKPREEKLPKDHAEWPRVHLEWALIDDTIAQQRLDDFREGMNPIWAFIRAQGAYFTAADALSDVLLKKQDPKQARAAVRAELEKVLDLLTNLKDQVGADARKEFLDFLAGQVQESCEFWVLRDGKGKEIAAKKKKLSDEAKTFEATLPLDLAKRADWKMSDPAKHDESKFQYLVAGVSGSGADDPKRTKNPDLLKKAVVRMNLVDQDHQEAFALGGFVFEVPPDCIYLAGAGLKTGIAEVAKLASGADTFKTMIKAAADTARGQQPNLALPAPAAVLAATKAAAFNEVFVAGTSLDEASAIKPVAVYVTIDVDTKNDGDQSSPLAKPVLEALSKIADERRLPVIHLYRKDPAPRASPPFAVERQA